MCGQLGMGELVVLLLIVVLVFGAGKLPQIGDALGRSVKNFKKAMTGVDDIDVTPKKEIATAKTGTEALAEGAVESDMDRMRREIEEKVRSEMAAEQAAKKSS